MSVFWKCLSHSMYTLNRHMGACLVRTRRACSAYPVRLRLKERAGGKLRRRDDPAKTPFQRLLAAAVWGLVSFLTN